VSWHCDLSSQPRVGLDLGTDRARAEPTPQADQPDQAHVDYLGQKYDLAKIKLDKIANEIKNTKADVANHQEERHKGDAQLRAEAIFAYVTNGAAASNNPLFSSSASQDRRDQRLQPVGPGQRRHDPGSNLKNYKIELTQERSILASESARAASAHAAAAASFHEAKRLQASLNHALAQVKGNIATFIAQAGGRAGQGSDLRSTRSLADGIPNPPPDSGPTSPSTPR
jgi:alpha-L-fucosidase